MKRVSAALAVVSAVLLMGTASAKVPDTSATSRLRQLGIMRPDLTPAQPGQAARAVSDLGEAAEGVDADVVNTVTDAIEDCAPLTDELLAGLPPEVAEILGSLPFMPEPVGEVPVPAGVVPEVLPGPDPAPAEEPKPEPEAAAAPIIRALPKLRTAAGDQAEVFPGLPATGHAGFTNGAVKHLDTLTVTGTQLENLDVAFSGSTFTSSPIGKTLTNEMARIVAPQLAANSGFGRGSGLEVSLLQEESAEAQIILAQRAEAKSPPSTDLITHEILAPNLDPIATASLLRGQAQSRAAAACTTGVDLSYGQGYALDAGLVGAGPDNDLVQSTATAPARAVDQSTSRTRLVPQAGTPAGPIAKFGLQSETRQTIAPVTLFEGLPNQTTIEIGGEWVLRATADGKSVGEVFYGPGTVEPSTPVLRILNKDGAPFDPSNPLSEITLQELLGQAGLRVEVPGVGEIVIAEAPRAIGDLGASSKPTESVTYSAGAVDVVRVRFLDGGLADLRIGHMEAAVAVPAGGIECGIGLLKKANPEKVKAGDTFDWTVTVTNPNDCVLTSVKVVDTISADPGIKWSVIGSNPKANTESMTSVIWNDVGPIQPGGKKDLVITVLVDKASGGGKFLDKAVANGVCGPAAGSAEAAAGAVGVPLEARVELNLPEVTAVLAEAPLRGELPRTGGLLATLPALALLGAGLVLRRLKGRG